MKKILLFLSFVLVIFIFLNIVISLKISKKNSSFSNFTPSPTTFSDNFLKPTTSFYPAKENEPTPKFFLPPSVLTASDNQRLEPFKNQKVETDDFVMIYSPFLNQFIVEKKKEKGEEKFFLWTRENNFEDLVKKSGLFVFTSQKAENYLQHEEENFQLNQEKAIVYHLSPTITLKREKTESGKELKSLIELLEIFFTFNNNTISSSSSLLPSSSSVSPSSFSSLFQEAGEKVGVPPKILEGVMRIEMPSAFNFSSSEISLYSSPGNVMPNCRPNACSATGVMQMTTGVDDTGSSRCSGCGLTHCPNAWASYGRAVNTYGGYSHNPHPCNIRDNIFAAAAKLKRDSDSSNPQRWSREEVFRAAYRYYGSCDDKHRYERLGGRTYCEYLWWYYTGD